VIPSQSTNTLFHFRTYCEQHPHLRELFSEIQMSPDIEDDLTRIENRFSALSYQVVHFVVDMPVRLPPEMAVQAPAVARPLGQVVFVQTEFQIIDRYTEQQNELGEASHAAYKERQRLAVMRRLKVGAENRNNKAGPENRNKKT
jgi:uncharacterized protein (TIGR04562 family)